MKMFFLLLLMMMFFSCQNQGQEKLANPTIKVQQEQIPQNRVDELRTFLAKNPKYNQKIAIFVNFKIPSKNYRFFIFDLKKKEVLDKSLVSHGAGSEVQNSNKLVFSNIENSHQSSLGKYEIANYYKGRFGWSYRLKGLDRTNNNAMKRAIVLHPYYFMRNVENGHSPVTSLGCFMLSPTYMKKISKDYIKPSKKPIIIYAFY